MGFLIYFVIGLLWGAFAAFGQQRRYGKRVGLAFVLNAIGWPIAVLIAIAKVLD